MQVATSWRLCVPGCTPSRQDRAIITRPLTTRTVTRTATRPGRQRSGDHRETIRTASSEQQEIIGDQKTPYDEHCDQDDDHQETTKRMTSKDHYTPGDHQENTGRPYRRPLGRCQVFFPRYWRIEDHLPGRCWQIQEDSEAPARFASTRHEVWEEGHPESLRPSIAAIQGFFLVLFSHKEP